MKYLFLLFLLFSCKIQENRNLLVNTKWESKIAEDCISSILFKADGTYENYNCEREYHYSGKYKIKQDTIYLFEIDLLSDIPSINEENNYKKGIIRRRKFVNTGTALQYVSWENYENGKWSGDIVYPENKFFIKKP